MKIHLVCLMSCIVNYTSADQWVQKADFIGPRSKGVAFTINQNSYVGTGFTALGYLHQDFWCYNPSNDSWTQIADLPGGERMDAFSFEAGGKGYVGGGWVFNGNLHGFWQYDPGTNTWIQKADFPTMRLFGVAFVIGNLGYVGTGISDSSLSNDFWQYNPAFNLWTRKSDFPGPVRCRATGFSIGGKGYIGTGEDANGNLVFNDFYEYDTTSDSWAAKANFGGGQISRASGFALFDKGYIGLGSGPTSISSELWQYNPLTDSWIQKLLFPGSPRATAITFAINNYGYVCGGDTFMTGADAFQGRTLWAYSPDSLDAIDELSFEESGLEIFPNPVHDFFNVHSKYTVLLSVYTEEGKEIFKNKKCETVLKIDAQNWPAGIYYLKAALNN